MAAATLYKSELFEEAFTDYQQAARLDPANPDYAMALEVARSHAVTALIQERRPRPHSRRHRRSPGALQRALAIDPGNANVTQHLRELARPRIGL